MWVDIVCCQLYHATTAINLKYILLKHRSLINDHKCYPGGSVGKRICLQCRRPGWEDPLEEGMAIHSSILAWEIPMNRGAWQAADHGIAKSRTQLSD